MIETGEKACDIRIKMVDNSRVNRNTGQHARSYVIETQEKTTNCGTKAADVLDKLFWPANFNANAVNILVHLQQL